VILLFEEKSEEFRKNNFKIIEWATVIDKYLIGCGKFYITPLVNIHTLCLKVNKETYQLNSNLIVDDAGYGKTTFLKILNKSIGKKILWLSSKIYPHELVGLGDDKFNNKILIHDDLVVAFSGLKTKTRQQLIGFFTLLLSEHFFEMLNRKISGKCLCMLGMARFGFGRNKYILFESTFFERVVPIYNMIRDNDDKFGIIKLKNDRDFDGDKLPKLDLSVNKYKDKKIKVNNKIKNEIIGLSLQFENIHFLSATRMSKYILQFCMANALINGRDEANEYDLEMYKEVHFYHICDDSNKLNYFSKILNDNKDKSDKWIIDNIIGKEQRRSFYRYKKVLKEMGKI
jgi:hypothetical protein